MSIPCGIFFLLLGDVRSVCVCVCVSLCLAVVNLVERLEHRKHVVVTAVGRLNS